MIQVCCYKGCGIVYGKKEPLDEDTITHGLCPFHHEITLKEIRAELQKLKEGDRFSNILIVEDHILFRELLKKVLHDRFPNIQINEAKDGEEALRKAETLHPGLIFMDISLPGENGLEVSKKIKTRFPEITIIILTGHDLPEYRESSIQFTDYFLSKDSATLKDIFDLTQSVSGVSS